MKNEKHKSENTVDSYRRDLLQFITYITTCGIKDTELVTKTDILSYLLKLQGEGRAAASISRMLILAMFSRKLDLKISLKFITL